MLITRMSPVSKKENSLEVPCTPEQLQAFEEGLHIQKAMPNVPAPLREFILSGVTPEEWDELFKDID